MQGLKDYYAVLGVEEDASQEEIKERYRELSKKYHPDVTELDPEYAKKKFIEVSEAYHILIDPQKRKDYDYLRKHGKANSELWERFEKDVANIHEFARILYEMQKYFVYKMTSSGVGGGMGVGAGAYIGWRAGGLLGAIAGGIIGGLLGMVGGSKFVDLIDGGEKQKLKSELTSKIISYVEKTPELRKPFVEYILLKKYEPQGIYLPVAYSHIQKILEIDERFVVLAAYLEMFGNFNKNFVSSIKGSIEDIDMLVEFAFDYAEEIGAENKIDEQIEILEEYKKLKEELMRLESSFFKDRRRISLIKQRLEELEEKYKSILSELENA